MNTMLSPLPEEEAVFIKTIRLVPRETLLPGLGFQVTLAEYLAQLERVAGLSQQLLRDRELIKRNAGSFEQKTNYKLSAPLLLLTRLRRLRTGCLGI